MDIATWNVNSLRAHLDQVLKWLGDAEPDVVCLQETKVTDDLFPHQALHDAGYIHRAIHGQKTYNGVAILSKFPLENIVQGFSLGEADPQARLIRATVQGITVINCYVPNGHALGSDKYSYKLQWYERLLAELHDGPASNTDLLICGDMNVAPGEADVYDPFVADEGLLCSEPERTALSALLKWGTVDAYRKKNPFNTEFSWWDYRGGAFRNNKGFRIDHIFLTKPLMRRCRKVRIDRVTRTWTKPSDHVPVVATFRT
jgi:exodeoxyribonuclease-3